jgi:RNA polymerase sigma factor (sigma-70 family)
MENRFDSPLVWKRAMIAHAGPMGARTWEARLGLESAADRSARFSELATAELDRVYRLAGLILMDASEAEDAVGDALERAWQRFGQLRDRATFRPWFDRIVVNACRDRLRRRRVVRFIPLEPAHGRPEPNDPFREVLDRDEMLRSMRSLPDDERLVVVLHFWADLTLQAVADRVGWPIGTVKSRLHRALERMRPTPGENATSDVPT